VRTTDLLPESSADIYFFGIKNVLKNLTFE